MSTSLVRKALDETTLAVDEKLEQLSKASKKKFKPQKKKEKLSQDKLLQQNLKILKAFDSKLSRNKHLTTQAPLTPPENIETNNSSKKKNSKKKQESGSVFTEEDFEKFEKEYFVD